MRKVDRDPLAAYDVDVRAEEHLLRDLQAWLASLDAPEAK